jgi:hypothetical protein
MLCSKIQRKLDSAQVSNGEEIMKYQNKPFQNIGILILVTLFVSLAFIGNVSSAKAENLARPTPPKSKKVAPTPKKNVKATPTPKKTTKSNQKTTAKVTPTLKKKDSKKDSKQTAKTDKKNNSKTVSKTDKNLKTKIASKTTKDSKTSSKKTQTASIKTTKTTTTNRNSRTVTPVKTKTTSDKTTATTKTQPVKELMQIVVSQPALSIRSAPNAGAAELSRAKLGSIYSVVEKSSGWYKVQIPNRTNTITGWIPATSAVDSDKNGNEEIYRQMLAKYPVSTKQNFGESVELYEFLTRVQPEIKNESTAAEFGLRRLVALRTALQAIPPGQSSQKPYQDFLKAQDENVVYSEPSGAWYVRAPLFWDLHSKYTATASGEKIAWEAAKNPLPGECEGYVNCHIFLIRMTDGEYLNYYPTGSHTFEALKNIAAFLEPIADDAATKKVYNGPTDVSDRAEFNSLITELRVIISRLPNTEKEKVLQQLKKIAEGFK